MESYFTIDETVGGLFTLIYTEGDFSMEIGIFNSKEDAELEMKRKILRNKNKRIKRTFVYNNEGEPI